MDWNPLKQRIAALAREAGFDLCGVAPASGLAELEYFPQWIAEGRHGEMDYLAARTAARQLKRGSLAQVAPWARSVIVCAINYNSPQPYSTECTDRRRGWIARYAWSERDYHDTVLERLRRVEASLPVLTAEFSPRRQPLFPPGTQQQPELLRMWCYVDTGPVVERVFAGHAGVGWLGKNTCIINQQLGSWLFLGVLLTSLPLPPDLPAADRCGSCTRCLDACPTAALTAPYQMDASRCISYLTIEKRGDIPAGLREGMGRNIFGCDICQDVCPWNREAPVSTVFAPAGAQAKIAKPMASDVALASRPAVRGASTPARVGRMPMERFAPTTSLPPQQANSRIAGDRDLENGATPELDPRAALPASQTLVNPDLRRLARMSAEEFRAAFRHSPVKRAKYQGLMRNVIVAIGNSGDRSLAPELEAFAHGPDLLLRRHARWALNRLRKTGVGDKG
jgi:epoxyqueuosine reductase